MKELINRKFIDIFELKMSLDSGYDIVIERDIYI